MGKNKWNINRDENSQVLFYILRKETHEVQLVITNETRGANL
jgi:hypothetical protein